TYKVRSGVIGAVCLLMVISFFCNVLFINSEPEFTFYSPITRFWELAIGAFLAVIINCKSESNLLRIAKNVTSWISKSKVRSDICSLFGSALLILAVLITSKSEQFPGWYALLPTFGTFLIILAGPHANVNKYLLSSKLMVWIGLVSFPLYLWHWPVFVFAKAHLGQVLNTEIQLILVIVSFILAFITFRFVERPLRFSSSKRNTAFTLLTIIACISLVSVYVFNKKGLASRFPPVVQNIINHTDVDATIHWRVGTCHLLPKQDYNSFSACESEPKDSSGKPTLLVWGDSHAAHLYPGLFISLSERYRIIQKTASTCPPIFHMDIPVSPNCGGVNDEMRKFIINERPDRIMLAAAWDVYDWNQLSSTIEWLKEIEIRHIDLVGPVPRWLDSLPRQLLVYFMSNGQKQIPVRMKNGLKPYVMSLDHDMSQFAKEHNINYLSPTQILCNSDGCLTRVGKENMSITAFDSSHLTEDGAKYVASQFNLTN
ncbi:acyltransferase, partial [Vibrio makurazakiensis]|uniref:acyltransferase family protein n=1 Tax=Vibrio makurazakiensis TaxID=2910250 RepID=UPI003D0A73BB